MKKYLTLTLALLMVLVSFGNVGFALQKSDPVHQSRMAYVSPGIIAQMGEGSIDDPIDAMVWTSAPIDKSLERMGQNEGLLRFEPFKSMSCYYVSATSQALKTIASMPETLRVQENYSIKAPDIKMADTKNTKVNWGLDDLKVKDLWKQGIRGQGVKVGLLDTGVDAKHPELAGKVTKFATFDTSGKIVPDVTEPFDRVGHGTHCAGIIAGGKNGQDGVGVAPDCELIVGSVIPGGNGTLAQVIGGMEWIIDPDGDPNTDDAPRVVSMSLGGSIPDEDMVAATDAFERKGILLVASIGNSGDGSTGSPGNIPSVTSVGAYDKNRQPASFSSGNKIDWEIEPYHESVIKPDVSAPGVSIYSTFPKGKYAIASGTSMATPHVAGVCALLMSTDKSYSAIDLRMAIKATADDLGSKGWDTRYGTGAINPKAALDYLKKTGKVQVGINLPDKKVANLVIGDNHYRVDKSFALHLPPGKTNIELSSFGFKKLAQEVNVVAGKSSSISYEMSELPKTSFKATMYGADGNPANVGQMRINGTSFSVDSDENGSFDTEVPTDEYDVEFWSIGYVPKTIKIDFSKDLPKKIQLEKADVLVVALQYTTPSQYYSRRFDKYCFRAFDEMGIKYCPVNPYKFDLTSDQMKMFDRVYWFAGENGLYSEDVEILEDYLKEGGKLLISGSNLHYFESYRRDNSFFTDNYGVILKNSPTPLTTMMGVKDDDIGDGLVFSFSGGDGASNQLGADGFVVNKGNAKPFMYYLGPKETSPADLGYTGLKLQTQNFLSIFLAFGFEGINSKEARQMLLSRVEKWFTSFGGVDITFEDDKGNPVYAKAKIDGIGDVETNDEGHLVLSYLPQGKISLKVVPFGFAEQSFTATVTPGKTTRISLGLSNPTSVKISGKVVDSATGTPMKCDFKITGFETKQYSTDDAGNFSLTLPKYKYSLKIFKKGYLNYWMDILDNAEDLKVKMEKPKRAVALFQQIAPSWDTRSFAGIAQIYERVARGSGTDFDNIIVPPGNIVDYEDMQQFSKIIWYCGFNDEIGASWWLDNLARYVNEGGSIAIIGQNVPQAISSRPELAKTLGFELLESNTSIYAVKGVKGDPIGDGLIFSLYHPFLRMGLLSVAPSMKPVGSGVSCFDYLGGASAGVRVGTDKQKTLVIPFGFENMYADTKESQDLFKRIVSYLGK